MTQTNRSFEASAQGTSPRTSANTPPHGAIAWAELKVFLERDQALSEALLALLDLERSHLQARDYAAFEELLERKQELVLALEQNSRQRHQWQQSVGLSDDGTALAAARTAQPELAEYWRTLADIWDACQQRSRVNDQICQRTRLVVGRVLDILSGNAGQGSTYDAGGTTRRLQSGRDIGSA